MMLGAIETARKSPPMFDGFGLTIGVGLLLPRSSFSTLIITAFR